MAGRIVTLAFVAAMLFVGTDATGRRRSVSPPPDAVRLGAIPASAEIVYHQDGFIYVMRRGA
jgi:hypothetical protein